MTYYELIISAYRKINADEITLSEYEKMIAPLEREISPDWTPWVPINNNKRPQDGQRVFISTATGKVHDVVWNSEYIHNYARNGCWYKNWFVLAWMPFFIEPYNAKSEKVPNFESKEYVEKRVEDYTKMLKSGILDCVKEKSQESEEV